MELTPLSFFFGVTTRITACTGRGAISASTRHNRSLCWATTCWISCVGPASARPDYRRGPRIAGSDRTICETENVHDDLGWR